MAEYLGAVGIAVNDLETSNRFYQQQLGMVQLQTIELPYIKEIVLGFAGSRSASVVLMSYTDGCDPAVKPDAKNVPVKLVFYVDDAKAVLENIRQAGYTVVRDAEAFPSMGGALIGFGKDPDGYLVELIQKPAK